MSDLLERAFAALGPGPTNRELELVAKTLLASGDHDALESRWDNFDEVVEIARAAGSSAFVALHLAAELADPDWRQRPRKLPNPDAHAHLRRASRDSLR